jgi:cysteine dioxygenase
MLLDRVSRCFADLRTPTPEQLAAALTRCRPTAAELAEHAGEPGVFPYGRRALLRTDHVELMVMNWAVGRMCAPHDHGGSFGVIRVVSGEAAHELYTLDQLDRPVRYLCRQERAGSQYVAARGMIHAMGNATRQPMLTVHAYSPPITGMIVYDLLRCAACVVSDDCGAWWPAERRQIVREIRLRAART